VSTRRAVADPAASLVAHRISSTTTPAIEAVEVWKTFQLPHERYTTVRERARHPLTGQTFETLSALAGVSFDVRPGEFFGVVGKNGSGKSTLLRCLAGIYPADSGRITVEGRLVPFIELGVGFSNEMTARENVVTNAVLFGLSRREAEARFDEIIAFAELERFVDQKLKNYSTGMAMRLAFATSVHVDGDILLFDEVLATGDTAFQEKCFRRFDQLRADGKTVVIVSHKMEMVTRFCDRGMLLHEGRVVAEGDAGHVAERYEELNAGWRPPAADPASQPAPATPTHRQPRLLGGDPARFVALTWTLAVNAFKVKYAGTALNWAWAIARPVALFTGLLVIFTALGRFNVDVSHYPANLLMSVVLWTFFAQVTANSVQSLSKRADLLRKLPFPHLAVPAAALLAGVFDLGINLVVVFAVVLGSGVTPQAGWLEFPVLLLLLAALTAGVTLLLSACYVRYRDTDQIWQVVSQTIFFLTPTFYVASNLSSEAARALLLANPIAAILTEVRHAVIDPSAPSAAEVLGDPLLVAVPIAIVFATVAVGAAVFRRESARAAELI
jgi:ABC-type polysaccharide/polyol phosphate transport system ATPase subunit/ABC-type polysaccharide/polyol phosphate export permease